jgi:hypothetical protein
MRAVPSLLLVVFLAGCATFKNTPIQDYVWEIGKKCEHVNSGWTITQVDMDGRYSIRATNATSSADFEACINDQAQRYPFDAWRRANQH